MSRNEELAIGLLVFVNADANDFDFGVLAMEVQQRGQLENARGAPCRPEIEQDDMTTVAGKVKRGGAVGQSEIRGWLAVLGGMAAAVAAGRKRQEEDRNQG